MDLQPRSSKNATRKPQLQWVKELSLSDEMFRRLRQQAQRKGSADSLIFQPEPKNANSFNSCSTRSSASSQTLSNHEVTQTSKKSWTSYSPKVFAAAWEKSSSQVKDQFPQVLDVI